MTEEELTVNWVTANTGFNPKEPLGKIAVRIFLAGLKAGRPEWHKVADGDLPKDNRLVLIQVVNGNSTMGIFYVNAWREIYNCKELTGVIAWCEIPKYTEE